MCKLNTILMCPTLFIGVPRHGAEQVVTCFNLLLHCKKLEFQMNLFRYVNA